MEVGRDPSMQAKQPKWSIPTAPSPENGTAFDLVGPFCVLGVSSALYVVERPTMKVVSCLSGGHSPQATVTTISCSESRLVQDITQPRKTIVASGDTMGTLVTWVLHESLVLTVLNKPARQESGGSPRDEQAASQAVRGTCWTGSDTSSKLLVALYDGGEVVVWDYLKGQPVWQSCLNPKQNLTHLVQCPFDSTCLCVTNDEGLVYVLYVSDDASSAEGASERVRTVEYKISATDSKFLRCEFGMAENMLHIALERTLIAFDIEYGIPLGSYALPKSIAAFHDILCVDSAGNDLLCSHRDGSVSAWQCSEAKSIYTMKHVVPTISLAGHSPRNGLCQILARSTPTGGGLGEGRIQVLATTANEDTGGYLHHFSAPDFARLDELRLEGMLRLLPQQCTAFALEPPAEAGGDVGRSALGTSIGTVEVVDLITGLVTRSFKVSTSALLGVKWLRDDLLLCFSSERAPGAAAAFDNRLWLLDLSTGEKRALRGSSGSDASAMRGVRTSKTGNHFLLLFKNGITELWRLDRKTLACSRVRVMNMPFTCVEFVQDIPPFFFPRGAGTQDPPGDSARSFGSLNLSAEGGERSRSGSNAETGPQGQRDGEILLFALPDRILGAVEVSSHSKKLRDLKPSFPLIEVPPNEVVTALSCNEQNLVVGTSSGEVRLWSQSKDHFGVYKLANWEGSVRKIISDPCFISSDFLVLSANNMFHRINVDHMPLKIERVEGNMPGTEILDATWAKNELGRQYVVCTRDGALVYSDQAVAAGHRTIRNLLLDPRTPDRLAVYMQNSLPLTRTPGSGSLADQPYSAEFGKLAKSLELTEIEVQQAHESYRKCVAELDNGAAALARAYGSGSAVDAVGCMKLVARAFGRSPEEHEFWDKLEDTLGNVREGNYGGVGCLWDAARQKTKAARSVYWHESYTGALNMAKRERRVLEYFVLGDRESAIAFLLAATPDESSSFYKDALRALALASFRHQAPGDAADADNDGTPLSARRGLQEKASKVLSAHCAGNGDVLSSIVMLGLIGRNLDAVLQLQDVGMWEHAATMTASYLEGDQRQEALERWAYHVIGEQKNLWRGLGILVSCGLYVETLEVMNREGLSLSFLTLFGRVEGLQGGVLQTERFKTMRRRHQIVVAKNLL